MKNLLQETRWKNNWSQQQLARISGVSQSTICAIENHRLDPKLSTVLKLAKALSVKVEDLFLL